MNNGKPGEGGGVARGIGMFVLLYGISWAFMFGEVAPLGIVLTGATVLFGLVAVFAGRTPRERGIGAGILIGAAIAMVFFAACFAFFAAMLDH